MTSIISGTTEFVSVMSIVSGTTGIGSENVVSLSIITAYSSCSITPAIDSFS